MKYRVLKENDLNYENKSEVPAKSPEDSKQSETNTLSRNDRVCDSGTQSPLFWDQRNWPGPCRKSSLFGGLFMVGISLPVEGLSSLATCPPGVLATF